MSNINNDSAKKSNNANNYTNSRTNNSVSDITNNSVDKLPSEFQFTMPAEWETHSATWMCWPFNDEVWDGMLGKVRIEYAELVRLIAKYEAVNLLVADDESYNSSKSMLLSSEQKITNNVNFISVPLNDVWFRDIGPTFVKNSQHLSFVKWQFNGWGNKFDHNLDNLSVNSVPQLNKFLRFNAPFFMEGGAIEVNGHGTLVTTKQCLLNKNRNPHLSQSDMDAIFKNYLGAQQTIWLDQGLEDDHTDGHVDTIVRFVDKNTLVCAVAEDKSDNNYEAMAHNLAVLKNAKNLNGEPFQVVPLPLPKIKKQYNNKHLPSTYSNFYIGNQFVAVPLYDDPNDARALEILKPLFPDRDVVGLSSKYIIYGGGSFHCLTQQQPLGTDWTRN